MYADTSWKAEQIVSGSVIARRAGELGVLFEVAPEQVTALAAWLGRAWSEVIEEVVPSRAAVLVRARGQLDDIVQSVLEGSWRSAAAAAPVGPERRIVVRYDGPDLLEVSERLGLQPSQVVELHTSAAHVVQHFGFSPGFPYLAGTSQALNVPRRATPRETVAGGSVAIAGGVTVIYPGGTPGGWNIIGHTETPKFWDLDRDPPNTFSLGDRVVFESRR